MKVLVLIDSGGRHDIVPECLEECQRQCALVEAEGKYSFEIVLNDKGRDVFMEWDQDADSIPDFCLWVGHDLSLRDDAIASFLSDSEFLRHRAIITGSVVSDERRIVCGGRSKRGRIVEPDPVIPVPCHLYDTALLFVPRHAFRKVATPSDIFRQSFFDYGCGEKAFRAGVARVVAPGIMAHVSHAPDESVWKDGSRPLPERAVSLARATVREMLRIIHSIIR